MAGADLLARLDSKSEAIWPGWSDRLSPRTRPWSRTHSAGRADNTKAQQNSTRGNVGRGRAESSSRERKLGKDSSQPKRRRKKRAVSVEPKRRGNSAGVVARQTRNESAAELEHSEAYMQFLRERARGGSSEVEQRSMPASESRSMPARESRDGSRCSSERLSDVEQIEDLPHASDGSESSEGEASEGSGDTVESSDALQLVCPQEDLLGLPPKAGTPWSLELDMLKQQVSMLSERLDSSFVNSGARGPPSPLQTVGTGAFQRNERNGQEQRPQRGQDNKQSRRNSKARSSSEGNFAYNFAVQSEPSSPSSSPSQDTQLFTDEFWLQRAQLETLGHDRFENATPPRHRSSTPETSRSHVSVAELGAGSPSGRLMRQDRLIRKLKKKIEDDAFKLREVTNAKEAAESRLKVYKEAADAMPKLRRDLEGLSISLQRSETIRRKQKEQLHDFKVQIESLKSGASAKKSVRSQGKLATKKPRNV